MELSLVETEDGKWIYNITELRRSDDYIKYFKTYILIPFDGFLPLGSSSHLSEKYFARTLYVNELNDDIFLTKIMLVGILIFNVSIIGKLLNGDLENLGSNTKIKKV